jgi:hypothetical protein
MPRHKSQAGETLLDFISSKEFREGDYRAMAVTLGFKPKKPNDFDLALERGDWLSAARYCQAHHQEIPQWLGDLIVKGALAKSKMGRPVDSRQRLTCYFAVRHLMIDEGKKQTEAEELAGAALHLSRQAVHQHYISLRDKYAPKK